MHHEGIRMVAAGRLTALPALLIITGCGRPGELPYTLEVMGKTGEQLTSFAVGDSDRDGHDEVYAADRHRREIFGPSLQFRVSHVESLAGMGDVNGDGRPDLAVACLEPDQRAWLSFYDLGAGSFPPDPTPLLKLEDPRYFRNHGRDYRTEYEWRCRLNIGGMHDLDNDGHDDLVLYVQTGFELIPRGVWVFDGKSLRGTSSGAEVLACWKMTNDPRDLVIQDFDGDQIPEILVNSAGFDNWTEHQPPEDWPKNRLDDRGRVHLLSFERTERALAELQTWEPAEAGRGVRALAGPAMERGGCAFYLFWPTAGRIEKIDGVTRKTIVSRSFPDSISALAHFERSSGFRGLIVSCEDGRMTVCNESLEEVNWAKPRPGLCLHPQVVADLDLDGREELVTSSGEDLYVLSLPDLGVLAHRGFGLLIENVLVRRAGAGPSELHVAARAATQRETGFDRDRDQVCFHCKMVGWLIPATFGLSALLIAFVSGLGMGGSGVWILLRVRRRRQREESVLDDQRRDEFLDTLRSVGHGKITSSTLSQLSMLIDHLRLAPGTRPDLGERLRELITSFREIAWPQLERIPQAARAARASPELVRSYQESLGVLKEALMDGGPVDAAVLRNKAASVVGAIAEVSLLRRRMLEEQAHYHRCDPVTTVGGMVEAAAADARRVGVKLSLHASRSAPAVMAFIRDSDLRVIIEDLLANALYALRDSQMKELNVSVDTTGERIVIDVSDTGPGIPEAVKSRIFERGFSTKEGGGGFGLYQASELLDRYGGRIYVAQTAPGAGTTMRVELLPA
ncbi:MAG: ATP-binding protein [Planctomycetota bacterium]